MGARCSSASNADPNFIKLIEEHEETFNYCGLSKGELWKLFKVFQKMDFDASGEISCFEFLHFLKAEIYQIHKIKAPKMTKTTVFRTYKFSKIDFT